MSGDSSDKLKYAILAGVALGGVVGLTALYKYYKGSTPSPFDQTPTQIIDRSWSSTMT